MPKMIEQPEMRISIFLDGHKIQHTHRGKLINWIASILKREVKYSNQTFFLAVAYMDNYINLKRLNKDILGSECLHVLGLASILVATKFYENFGIPVKKLEKVGGRIKITAQNILEMELELMTTLEFKFNVNTLYNQVSIDF